MSYLFGRRADGSPVMAFELRNNNGMLVRILTMGAIVQALHVPDRRGISADVVLGHQSVAEYESKRQYFGATVGRYANRIARGEFTLQEHRIILDKNDGPNHLHGGAFGFDMANWVVEGFDQVARRLTLRHTSRDGESGYPGTCRVTAEYTLDDDNSFAIYYCAESDRPTIANITHHGYFNLAGEAGTHDVLDHLLRLNAPQFTPIDATSIPSGELRDVAGTPFDFTSPKRIGERIFSDDEQLRFGRGYDHNFVIAGELGKLRTAAELEEPTTGRHMELQTTAPGVQFYSGNVLDGLTRGKSGTRYRQHFGLCLEPQLFPDTPNHLSFPSAVLLPGHVSTNRIVFKFSHV